MAYVVTLTAKYEIDTDSATDAEQMAYNAIKTKVEEHAPVKEVFKVKLASK